MCSYFLPSFKKFFHNTVMIYNIKNRNTDTSQKEKKTCFNAHAGGKLTVHCIVK